MYHSKIIAILFIISLIWLFIIANMIRQVFIIILSMFTFLSPTFLFGADDVHHDKKSSKQSSEVSNVIWDDIKHLSEEADYLADVKYDLKKADSLYQIALNKALASFDDVIILKTCINYINSIAIEYNLTHLDEVVKYAHDAMDGVSNSQLIFDAYTAMSNVYMSLYDLDRSLSYSMKLMSNATTSPNVKNKIRAFIQHGKALELNDKKTDAFENYLDAQELIASLHDHDKQELQFDLNGKFYDFYLKINQFEKAVFYKRKQIEHVSVAPVDSNQLMWLKMDLCVVQMNEDKDANLKPQLEPLILYSERNHNNRMFYSFASIYRTYLLNTGDFKGFKDLFVDRYPENLQLVKKEIPPLYFIILASLQEDRANVDSARYYFSLAEEEVKKIDNDIYGSNFYKRYGEFLLRNNFKQEALGKFEISYQKAKAKEYLDYMLPASSYIEELSAELKDYKTAYEFGKIQNELELRKSQAMHEDNILKMELKSQTRQKEIISEKKAIEKKRIFNLQYAIIIVAIMSLFMLLILASSLTVPEWLIEMLGFFSILFLFEFITILMDHQIHHITHGEPLRIFLIKIVILTILFPLHHLIETRITNYMKRNKMIGRVSWKSFKAGVATLWPWLTPNFKKEKH